VGFSKQVEIHAPFIVAKKGGGAAESEIDHCGGEERLGDGPMEDQ